MSVVFPTNDAVALSVALRAGTRDLHRDAERSGIMPAMLRGRLERYPYCVFLRNLHAIYAALESCLTGNAAGPWIEPWLEPLLFRHGAIAADLRYLHGAHWAALPCMATTGAYVARIATLARIDPRRLIAHAYVRYLGDLSGGQILRGIIQKALDLGDEQGTAFYRFGASQPQALATRFRQDLDRLSLDALGVREIVDEACYAFAMHVRLFKELDIADAASAQSPRPAE